MHSLGSAGASSDAQGIAKASQRGTCNGRTHAFPNGIPAGFMDAVFAELEAWLGGKMARALMRISLNGTKR